LPWRGAFIENDKPEIFRVELLHAPYDALNAVWAIPLHPSRTAAALAREPVTLFGIRNPDQRDKATKLETAGSLAVAARARWTPGTAVHRLNARDQYLRALIEPRCGLQFAHLDVGRFAEDLSQPS
jgi:hypothetical protein